MELLGTSRLKVMSPNIKALVGPLLAILVLSLLFIISVQGGYNQITLKMGELAAATRNEKVLEEKASILREVRSSLGNADKTVIALPYKNPGLWMLSQLKAAAEANSLAISDFELVDELKYSEDIAKMQISFSVDGASAGSLLVFIKSVSNLAPISTVDSVDLKQEKDKNPRAEVKLSVYWSEPPSVLPPITSPVKQLTSSEQELLSRLSGLVQPQFTVFPPSVPGQRENPFE